MSIAGARPVAVGSALCAFAVVCLAGPADRARPVGGPGTQQSGTIALLDRYERGEHEAAARELMFASNVSSIKKDLEKFGPAWTEALGSGQVRRRRLVAATLALEAASLRFWPEEVDPLIEWGCQLLRKDAQPDEPERLWQLASVAVFGRARDDGQVVTRAGPGAPLGSRKPPARRPVDHVAHARQRFPDEPRFRLAEAMLVAVSADSEPPRDAEWVSTEQLSKNSDAAIRRARALQAIQMFERLLNTPMLRAEAELRMGYLWLALHEPRTALTHFAQARDSKDVFIAYLAQFLGGRAADMLTQHEDADAMYRSALVVIPHAQSAADALAANAFLNGKPDEAYALTDDALSAQPRPDDPWHLFGYGDLRFVPALMSQLREAIK